MREVKRKYRATRTEWIRSLKEKPCADCGGEFPPECMDFHHRDPSTKAVGNNGRSLDRAWSKQRILDEIAKCDLICANCHRIRTRRERDGSSS